MTQLTDSLHPERHMAFCCWRQRLQAAGDNAYNETGEGTAGEFAAPEGRCTCVWALCQRQHSAERLGLGVRPLDRVLLGKLQRQPRNCRAPSKFKQFRWFRDM
eukprot:6196584-Pleurochrysis_carterae.AAC.4